MPQTITAVGSLRSDESITRAAGGRRPHRAIGFQEGQPVAKGATLVKLDPAINDAEVQQAKANLTLAKAKYERAVDLQKQDFISGQARDEAENNLKVAEAAVSLAAARLAKTEIRAPFAGIIGLRSVSVGDYVKEGADIVNLESIDPLKVDFRVPEIYMKQVQVGQSLQVSLDALPGKTLRRPGLRDQSAGRRRGPRDRHPRAGAQRRTRRCGPACSRACGSSPRTSATRWSCPSRRWCRRARISTSSASSTARRRAPRSRSASAATAASRSSRASMPATPSSPRASSRFATACP